MSVEISVSVAKQRLVARNSASGEVLLDVLVATAANGVGQQSGSEQTPLGRHRVRAKIGAHAPNNAVFVGRRPTGERYSRALAEQFPHRDWILTRILWLCGEEPGHNRGGNVDTQRRYIYIHGAPDEHAMGVPSSHGCIKMRNTELIKLFDLVSVGDKVDINQ